MKRDNKAGPEVLGDRGDVPRLEPNHVAPRLGDDRVLFDTRGSQAYRDDTVRRALFVPKGANFVTYASYAWDPDGEDRGVVLLADSQEEANRLRDALSRVGIDRVEGYVASLDDLPRDPLASVDPEDLDALDDAFVLDVRTANEFGEEHIPGATNIHVGRLRKRLDQVPRERPIVVHCQTGGRAAVAEGILRREGYERVIDLAGSFEAWKETQAEVA
jgi:hydroxyacylglutathione hydrolase